MLEEQDIVIDQNDIAEFIQGKFLEEGVVITVEDIHRVLDYETEFLVSKGIIIFDEE